MKKKRLNIERELLSSSSSIIWNLISTPEGLSRWIADDVKLVCSGVGCIRAKEMKALNVEANVSGVGSVTCYASEKIDGTVSGVGSLKYAGNPKVKNTRRTGIGGISEL